MALPYQKEGGETGYVLIVSKSSVVYLTRDVIYTLIQ
jgi:hypothetical protein